MVPGLRFSLQRVGITSALTLVLVGGALHTAAFASTLTSSSASSPASSALAANPASQSQAAMPASLYPAYAAALTKDDAAAYAVQNGQANNPAPGFGLRFGQSGAQIQLGSGAAFNLALNAYGYGARLQPVSAISPDIAGNRVTYQHGNITEWYVNTALGLEQGFTVNAPSSNIDRQGDLTLQLATNPTAQLSLATDGQTVTLSTADGANLSYGRLSVTDAAGK